MNRAMSRCPDGGRHLPTERPSGSSEPEGHGVRAAVTAAAVVTCHLGEAEKRTFHVSMGPRSPVILGRPGLGPRGGLKCALYAPFESGFKLAIGLVESVGARLRLGPLGSPREMASRQFEKGLTLRQVHEEEGDGIPINSGFQ